jgi:hypothetical protein
MAIDFSCSSCQKNYRVKDKLAGKTAECTACGKKMRIPQLVAAASESDIKSDIKLRDLIDDELPTKASATLTPAVTTTCKECGAPLSLDAVLCVACGFDKRVGDVLETESEKEIERKAARGTSDFLKRGGAFSFLGAMIGAGVWLGLAIVANVGVQVGYPAIMVGLLAGAGMNRGYGPFGKSEVSPTFIAGLIAAMMALAGAFAAKGLIFDHLRGKVRTAEADGVSVDEIMGNLSPDSMLGMFGPLELLFIAIAMAAAYALARGDSAMEIKDTA